MGIKLSEKKKKDPINATITLPIGSVLKSRYERVKVELVKRDYESLHEFTRTQITKLLDEIEAELSSAG